MIIKLLTTIKIKTYLLLITYTINPDILIGKNENLKILSQRWIILCSPNFSWQWVVALLIYEDESNHCSYVHYLSNSEKKAWKIQTCMRVEPMTSAILVLCFNNWTYKPSWSWSFWWFVINLKVINKWLWIYGYHTSELPFNTQRNLLESEAFCFIRTCNRLESFTVEKQCKMICIPIKKNYMMWWMTLFWRWYTQKRFFIFATFREAYIWTVFWI